MSVIIRTLILSFAIALISACGGGGDGDGVGSTPTDRSLEFNILPADYFSDSYSATYVLSGSGTDGNNYSSTWNISSGIDTFFNSKPVKAINEEISVSNTSLDELIFSVTGLTYFTKDINNLTVEGSYVPSSGLRSIATATTVIPITARIGDYGAIGDYTKTGAITESATWSLEDGFNGLAKLVITDIEKDTFDNLESTEIQQWLIRPDGTRLNVDVEVTYHKTGLIITLIGQ